jgi:predicted PhzF superfamily epimerase YddE/YHI9
MTRAHARAEHHGSPFTAREFNHPETVFVFAPADPAHRARVRIFTPARELPFAGHPTVGTAVLLGLRNGGGRDIVLEEGIGAVRCTFESRDGGGSARFTIPQLPPSIARSNCRRGFGKSFGQTLIVLNRRGAAALHLKGGMVDGSNPPSPTFGLSPHPWAWATSTLTKPW